MKDDPTEDTLLAVLKITWTLTGNIFSGVSFQYSYPRLHAWISYNLSCNSILQHNVDYTEDNSSPNLSEEALKNSHASSRKPLWGELPFSKAAGFEFIPAVLFKKDSTTEVFSRGFCHIVFSKISENFLQDVFPSSFLTTLQASNL